jgi:hypothetical protein
MRRQLAAELVVSTWQPQVQTTVLGHVLCSRAAFIDQIHGLVLDSRVLALASMFYARHGQPDCASNRGSTSEAATNDGVGAWAAWVVVVGHAFFHADVRRDI